MTARVVGTLGTITRTETLSPLASRTQLSGNVTVGTGTWRVVALVNDSTGQPATTTTTDVTGPATVPVSVDHMVVRGSSTVTVRDAVMVAKQTGGVWKPYAGTPALPQTIAALGTVQATKLGVNIFAQQPGNFVNPAHYWPTPAQPMLDAMPTGLDCVRVGIPWAALQQSSSAWTATEANYLDTFFAAMNTRGLSVILTVGTTPAWARSGGTFTDPPTLASTFQTWVDAVITRWGSTVNILSVDPWNEPNNATSYTGTTAQMAGLIKATHDGAAGRCNTSLGSIAFADSTYIASLFTNGLLASHFDVVDIHPYPIGFDLVAGGRWLDPRYAVNDSAIDRSASLACGLHLCDDVLAANGKPNPTYIISEVGVSVHPFDTSGYLEMTDARSAEWFDAILNQITRHPRISAAAVFECYDRITGTTWTRNFGVLGTLGEKRAKYATFDTYVA